MAGTAKSPNFHHEHPILPVGEIFVPKALSTSEIQFTRATICHRLLLIFLQSAVWQGLTGRLSFNHEHPILSFGGIFIPKALSTSEIGM